MGIILAFSLFLLLLAVLWGPVIFILRKNNVSINTGKIKILFITQVLIVIILVAAEEAVGLLNPGGLILITTVIVSFLGYIYAKNHVNSG